MDTSKIIRGPIGIGPYTRTAPITQWDYGYRFIPDIDDLPATYRIDFANNKDRGEALPVYGDETGAEVPEELIATGKDVFAFYVHIEEGFARTAHTWRIPNHLRAKAGDREPTPSQQDSIDQLISRSNAAVTAAEQSASDAADSAGAAADSADAAAQSAASAAESAQGTEDYATRAEAAQTASEAAQSASESAAQTATTKAAQASAAESAAVSAAQTATAKAIEAAQIVEGVEGYADAAEQSAQSAAASATTASTKASEASQSASTASTKASEASQSATNAQTYANTAQAAQTAAETAQGKAEDAQTAAETAQGKAEDAQTGAEAAKTATEGMLNDKAPVIIETASGSIASFSDGSEMPMKSLVVNIEPVQDLHGQDAPYPAGGGVNQWDEEWENGRFNIDTGDKSYGNGIRSKNMIPVLPSTTYYALRGTYTGAASILLLYYDADQNFISYENKVGTGSTFTTPSNCHFINLNIQTSAEITTYNHDISINYPSTDTEYHPYSNICPISGWTGVTVQRTGKNLLDTSDITDYSKWSANIAPSGGMPSSFSNKIYSFPKLKSGVEYTISFGITSASFPTFLYFGYHKDGVGTKVAYVTTESIANQSITFTALDDVTYCLRMGNTSTQSLFAEQIAKLSYVQLELGSTATAYALLNGNTYFIYWQTEAGTVYGGTLDIVSGVLTVDRQIFTLDGSSDEYIAGSGKRVTNTALRGLITVPTNSGAVVDGDISNWLAHVTGNTTYVGTQGFSIEPNGDIHIADGSKAMTASGLREMLVANPLVLALKIPTTQTYQLTPTEVQSILGQNHVWADCGDVEVEYRANTKLYIQRLTQPEEDDLVANSAITSGQFFMIGNTLYRALANIASGATITVGTNAQRVSLSDALNLINS